MTDEELLAEIIALAKQKTGAKTVTSHSRLYGDLGMDGDDADEFFKALAIKYDVDLSGLLWGKYFEDEPTLSDMLRPALVFAASVLSPSFAVRWQAANEAMCEVTIGHLAEVVRAKVWRDPDPAQVRRRWSSPLTLIFSIISLVVLTLFAALGAIVVWGFVSGELGNSPALALFGVVAMGLFPIYLAFMSWRQIQRKLDLAPRN